MDLRLAVAAVMPSTGFELRTILSILLYFVTGGVSASAEGDSPRRKRVIAPRDIVAGESGVEFGVRGLLFVFLEGTELGLSDFKGRMGEGLVAVFLTVLRGRSEEVAHFLRVNIIKIYAGHGCYQYSSSSFPLQAMSLMPVIPLDMG